MIRSILRRLPAEATAAIALAALVVALAVLAAAAPRPGTGWHGAASALANASPSATPSAAPSATPLPTAEPRHPAIPVPAGYPVALGASPEAGGIVFAGADRLGGNSIWRYDGASGTVTPIGARGHVSADGHGYVVTAGTRTGANGPFRYVDAATGAEVQLSPDGASDADAILAGAKGVVGVYVQDGALYAYGRDGAPARLMDGPGIGQVRADPTGTRLAVIAVRGDENVLLVRDVSKGIVRTFVTTPANVSAIGARTSQMVLGSWSPDGRYLTVFGVSISNSVNADGVDLFVVDAESGERTDLGRVLAGSSRLAWTAPHRLAYVLTQSGRFTWQGQRLRIWSPEEGVTAVTPSDEVGLNPSWSADGRSLWFITAQASDYVPLDFFAGSACGDRRLARYEPTSGARWVHSSFGTFIVEGARPSFDGRHLLVLQRDARVAASLDALPPVPLELVLYDLSTWRGVPLVRIASDVGFGYYGGYTGPQGMAWSR